MAKKLYRIKNGSVLAGVCSGLGSYLDVDPVIIRLLWVIAAFCFGGGLLAYIIAIFLIPSQDKIAG